MELTREQIKEGNEKLAKLIGWYQEELSISGTWWVNNDYAKYVAYSIHNNYPHQDLPFHRDWNYLMKVVDKIGTLVYRDDHPEYNWKTHYSYSELFTNIFTKWLRNHFEQHNNSFNLMNDLTSIWCGCVAYVDWYEQNKDEKE